MDGQKQDNIWPGLEVEIVLKRISAQAGLREVLLIEF